jgi:hypothetical protein
LEILNGLYRLKTPHLVEEKHGGVTTKDEVYWYLAFYSDTNVVALYGSGSNDYKRFISREFELTGKITAISEDTIKFFIHNPFEKINIIFEGKIVNNRNTLRLKGYKENTPDKLWINDEFEYVVTDML